MMTTPLSAADDKGVVNLVRHHHHYHHYYYYYPFYHLKGNLLVLGKEWGLPSSSNLSTNVYIIIIIRVKRMYGKIVKGLIE